MNEYGFLEGYLLGIISTCVLLAIVAVTSKRKERRPFVVNPSVQYMEPITPDELEHLLYEEHRRQKGHQLQ
jgi:hypothetical protein